MPGSKVAKAAAKATAQRLARLSPAERTHNVDRSVAIKRIKETRRLGRRASASAAADER
jgi:hypothetical protein